MTVFEFKKALMLCGRIISMSLVSLSDVNLLVFKKITNFKLLKN